MVRFVALAALAAAIAGPASAEGVRVSLVSKSPAQIQADISSAARQVCLRATSTESFRLQAFDRCVKDTVAVSLAQIAGADVAVAKNEELAQR